MASAKDNVKALDISGVTPTEESIENGSYTIQRPFVLVTKADSKLSNDAQEFFNYITSDEANDIIIASGMVPAN